MPDTLADLEDVAGILRTCLEEGLSVEIQSVGVFRVEEGGRIRFTPSRGRCVFLAYAIEDVERVEALCDALEAAGFRPWLDRRRLLPGQNWPRAIERAISVADFFVPCFSHRALAKPGRFHAELRYALDCALERPMEGTYLVPVRLDDCRVPSRIARRWQYVDLFPEPAAGLDRLIRALAATNPASS